jgi:hypothetical protein
MPQAGRIRVEGLKEIDRRLGRLPNKLQHKILKEAVKEAVAPVIRAARALAPVETGTLRRSIGVRIKSYQKKQTWVAVVGPKRVSAPKFREGLPTSKAARDPRFYGHLVESGAQPHKQKGRSNSDCWPSPHGIATSWRQRNRFYGRRLEGQ